MSDAAIEDLELAIKQAQRVVCFTGAGISTESGIPDFRSPGTGIWNKMKPIQFQDFVNSAEARKTSWSRKFSSDRTMDNAEPNIGHYALAKLVARGKCSAIITQNVDNLHQHSGVPDQQVIELHGNATYASCLKCGARYELDELEQQFKARGEVDDCPRCGGLVKTATISFGQSMPEEPMRRAQQEIEACDLCIVLGSSLTVYPAAGFPEYAKQLGATLAIVNREETPLDEIADIVIREQIGGVMSAATGLQQ